MHYGKTLRAQYQNSTIENPVVKAWKFLAATKGRGQESLSRSGPQV